MPESVFQQGALLARRASIATLSGIWLGIGASVALLSPAAAQTPADIVVLAGPCANCHGPDGRSPGQIVSLAGRPQAVLLQQLQAFKSDNPPPGTTVMNRLAKGYSDEQIAALAGYFSKISPNAPAAAPAKKKGK